MTDENKTKHDHVVYKDATGVLTCTDKLFEFEAQDGKKGSVKVSWARVEKRQLSPPNAPKPMMKLILTSGKQVVFEVPSRDVLEELRADVQSRMDYTAAQAAAATQSQRDLENGIDGGQKSMREWVDEPEDAALTKNGNGRKRVTTTTKRTITTTTDDSKDDRSSMWSCCCVGSIFWVCICICLLLLVAVVLGLVYWFVIKDSPKDILGITSRNESQPPDWGHGERYGIRQVNYTFDTETLTLQYEISDYILDNSVSYILYNNDQCRKGKNNVVTNTDPYLFITIDDPKDNGANLKNNGQGSREFDVVVQLRKDTITNAPYYVSSGVVGINGQTQAQLTFCIGLSIIYNRVQYWNKQLEVRDVVFVIIRIMRLLLPSIGFRAFAHTTQLWNSNTFDRSTTLKLPFDSRSIRPTSLPSRIFTRMP